MFIEPLMDPRYQTNRPVATPMNATQTPQVLGIIDFY